MNVIHMEQLKSSKREQLSHENKTWLRSLEYFKQENSYLKFRLSAVLDATSNKDFLALAEQFQNKFLVKDSVIEALSDDIHILAHDLAAVADTNLAAVYKVVKAHEKMQADMEYFENDFSELKHAFNKYLSSIL